MLEEFTMQDLIYHEFIILTEEDNNIDIEELNDTCYDKHFYGEDKEYYHNLTRETLNKVIRIVKQHDREIKELKE